MNVKYDRYTQCLKRGPEAGNPRIIENFHALGANTIGSCMFLQSPFLFLQERYQIHHIRQLCRFLPRGCEHTLFYKDRDIAP